MKTIESFGDIGLALVSATEGFCTSTLFLHWASYRATIETIWKDWPTLAASRGVSASARADFVAATDSVITALEEYGLDFSSRWD
jgi:hypothetical protein